MGILPLRIFPIWLVCIFSSVCLLPQTNAIDYLWLTESEWKAELTHESDYRKRLAIAYFAIDGVTYDSLLPILVDKLTSDPRRFQNSDKLYEAIGNYGDKAEEHIPLLINALKLGYSPVYKAFRGIGYRSIEPLNELLDGGKEEWQINAIRTFERLKFEKLNKRLYYWLDSGNPRVRAACAKAIWECYKDPIIASRLGELLESTDAIVNRTVTRLVGDMGIKAAIIQERIGEVLKKNPRIRGNYYLRQALSEIQDARAKQP